MTKEMAEGDYSGNIAANVIFKNAPIVMLEWPVES